MGIEHRFHPRYHIDRVVKLSQGGKWLCNGRVIEISLGGMKIKRIGRPLEEGRIVSVDFQASPHSRTEVSSLRAMVIYSHGDTSGLMFSDEFFADGLALGFPAERFAVRTPHH